MASWTSHVKCKESHKQRHRSRQLEDESVLGPWDPHVAGARAGTGAVESVSRLLVSLYHLSLRFHSSAHFLNLRSQLVSVRWFCLIFKIFKPHQLFWDPIDFTHLLIMKWISYFQQIYKTKFLQRGGSPFMSPPKYLGSSNLSVI